MTMYKLQVIDYKSMEKHYVYSTEKAVIEAIERLIYCKSLMYEVVGHIEDFEL